MFKYVSAGLAVVLIAAIVYAQALDSRLQSARADLTSMTRERDNLRSELATANARLAQSQIAQDVTAAALQRAQAASRELASIKDWIRGNEDTPVPAWFNSLLVRLGFGLRDPASGGQD